MKTLAILSRKGGAGKTTLAVHLAVLAGSLGRKVLIVDCDPQKSATRWYEAREAKTPMLVSCGAERLAETIKAARLDGVDLVIVDSRPSVERDTTLIAAVADLSVIPTRPSALDLLAIGETIAVLRAAKRKAVVVLNSCPPSRAGWGEASLVRDARTMLSSYHCIIAPIAITQRSAFASALVDGRAVSEIEPQGKATREISKLFQYLEKNL